MFKILATKVQYRGNYFKIELDIVTAYKQLPHENLKNTMLTVIEVYIMGGISNMVNTRSSYCVPSKNVPLYAFLIIQSLPHSDGFPVDYTRL